MAGRTQEGLDIGLLLLGLVGRVRLVVNGRARDGHPAAQHDHHCKAVNYRYCTAFQWMAGPWKLIFLAGLACNEPIQLRGLLAPPSVCIVHGGYL